MSYSIFDYFIQTSVQDIVCSSSSFGCKVAVNTVLGDEHPYLSAASQHNHELSGFEKVAVGLDIFSVVLELVSALSSSSNDYGDY